LLFLLKQIQIFLFCSLCGLARFDMIDSKFTFSALAWVRFRSDPWLWYFREKFRRVILLEHAFFVPSRRSDIALVSITQMISVWVAHIKGYQGFLFAL
jgi:hypothetical protein